MPPTLSPNSTHSHLSPKSTTSNPNINPFAPLSPDMPEGRLLLEDDNDGNGNGANGVDGLLSMLNGTKVYRGPRKMYDRSQLLSIAARCRKSGWVRPKGLGGLETWYGDPSHIKSGGKGGQHLEDPAIASIDPGGPSRRGANHTQGGFGEGFGFGGGIGGSRGIGKGVRNIGLRRQPDGQLGENGLPLPKDAYGGQMGKFSVRGSGDRLMRLGGEEPLPRRDAAGPGRRDKRDEGDWRRGDKGSTLPARLGERRPHQPWHQRQMEEEGIQPAWMDDGPSEPLESMDPAIAGLSGPGPGPESSSGASGADSFMQFVPGQDLIAAHRKNRGNADDWRGGGRQLAAFFGGPDDGSSGAALPAKAKTFNAADFILAGQADGGSEEKKDDDDEGERKPAFQSRFARFFDAPKTQTQPAPQDRLSPPATQTSPFGSSSEQNHRSQHSNRLLADIQNGSQSQPFPTSQSGPTPPDGLRVDDHMARLMGLLSTKTSPAPPEPAAQGGYQGGRAETQQSPYEHPPQEHYGGRDMYDRQERQDQQYRSPPQEHKHQYSESFEDQRSHYQEHQQTSPPPAPPPGHGYGRTPQHLLQELYQSRNSSEQQYRNEPSPQTQPPQPSKQTGPDLLQMLMQGQGQNQGNRSQMSFPPPPPGMSGPPPPNHAQQRPPQPSQHLSLPPGFGPGPGPATGPMYGGGPSSMRSPQNEQQFNFNDPRQHHPQNSGQGFNPGHFPPGHQQISPRPYAPNQFQQFGGPPPGMGSRQSNQPGPPPPHGFPPGMNPGPGMFGGGPPPPGLRGGNLNSAQQDMLAALSGLPRAG